MRKIYPCLWFDSNAEQAARFYVSVFKRSSIDAITHYGKGHPGPEGKVMTVEFHLGQKFIALNGGPAFKFSHAISLVVDCKDQKELDYYWKRLARGGRIDQCGWLRDRFGLSWQVVPAEVDRMFLSKDKRKTQRLMDALLKMKKLDIAALKRAFNGTA